MLAAQLGLLLLPGCAPEAPRTDTVPSSEDTAAAPDTGSDEDTGSDKDTGSDEDTGSGDPTWQCPTGMVPVGGDLSLPDFCIDQYEATVTGEIGDPNQHSGTGTPTTATAESVPEVMPSVGISFDQAKAICGNTPVLDSDQNVVGTKRLAASQEWSDAADGTLGSGGLSYPYGDEWIDDACATPLRDGQVVLETLQRTGSLAECVSPFGVYDAVGNAWEWSDSGAVHDISGVLAIAQSNGIDISKGPGGSLVVSESALAFLGMEMAGLIADAATFQVGEGGILQLGPDAFDLRAHFSIFKGHLLFQKNGEELGLLPVWFDEPTQETAPRPAQLLWEADGAAIPHKRGCAYYTGNANGCQIQHLNRTHLHDFFGTISFRCVADPFLQ
jgi:hypothetical protein